MALACGQKAQAQLLLLNDADPVLPQENNEPTDPVGRLKLICNSFNVTTRLKFKYLQFVMMGINDCAGKLLDNLPRHRIVGINAIGP